MLAEELSSYFGQPIGNGWYRSTLLWIMSLEFMEFLKLADEKGSPLSDISVTGQLQVAKIICKLSMDWVTDMKFMTRPWVIKRMHPLAQREAAFYCVWSTWTRSQGFWDTYYPRVLAGAASKFVADPLYFWSFLTIEQFKLCFHMRLP